MAQNDFFTVQSLATFAGTVGATTVVANGLQRAFDYNPKWLALLIAQVLCLVVVLMSHQNASPGEVLRSSDYFIAILNGFLVYCSSAGVNSAGGAAIGVKHDASAAAVQRGGSTLGNANASKRRFWSPWF